MMYQVSATTYNDKVVDIKVIDKSLALDYFNNFISCEDCADSTIINGLTGEVLFQWIKGKFIVLDGTIL